MSMVERGIGAPVARVGDREADIVAEEIDTLDLPLPHGPPRDREQAFAGGNEQLVAHRISLLTTPGTRRCGSTRARDRRGGRGRGSSVRPRRSSCACAAPIGRRAHTPAPGGWRQRYGPALRAPCTREPRLP